MTVRELIEKLQSLNAPDLKIVYRLNDSMLHPVRTAKIDDIYSPPCSRVILHPSVGIPSADRELAVVIL